MMPRIPVSCGELIDKITILEIKVARLGSPGAVANVERELAALREIAAALPPSDERARLTEDLRAVNLELWEVEDAIRAREAARNFDAGFIDLARAVYRANDRRAEIKRAINQLLGSTLVEEKHYTGY